MYFWTNINNRITFSLKPLNRVVLGPIFLQTTLFETSPTNSLQFLVELSFLKWVSYKPLLLKPHLTFTSTKYKVNFLSEVCRLTYESYLKFSKGSITIIIRGIETVCHKWQLSGWRLVNREVYNRAIDTQHENTLVSSGTQENYGAITFLPLTICAESPKRSESSWCIPSSESKFVEGLYEKIPPSFRNNIKMSQISSWIPVICNSTILVADQPSMKGPFMNGSSLWLLGWNHLSRPTLLLRAYKKSLIRHPFR